MPVKRALNRGPFWDPGSPPAYNVTFALESTLNIRLAVGPFVPYKLPELSVVSAPTEVKLSPTNLAFIPLPGTNTNDELSVLPA